MKKTILLFSCFFFSFHLFGQTLSINQLRADFDTLRHALEESHGGLYRFYSRPQMDMRFDEYRSQLKKPVSLFEFYGFLSKLIASIGDGHMRLDYDATTLSSMPRPLLFPFRILMEKSRAIILSNDTKDDRTIKPGMELLGINGRSIGTIKKTILPHLRTDGFNQSGPIASLERSFSQNYWFFADTSSIFIIKVKDSSGKVLEATIKGVLNPERESNRNQNPVNAKVLSLTRQLEGPANNAYLGFINDSITAMRLRYFIGDRFTNEMDSLFELISKHNTKVLILDIRGNGGGLDEWGAYLASKFVTRPFRYIDRVHARVLIPSFAEWKLKPPVDLVNGTMPDPAGGYLIKPVLNSAIGEQQPARHPFTGKLIVLIDGKTFSAASDFSAILSNLTNAIFVGEETGGGYQGNTSALNVILKLPNARFNINIHLWDYWSAVKSPGIKGRGVIPDYRIGRKPNDWLKGIDTQWEYALKLCLTGKP